MRKALLGFSDGAGGQGRFDVVSAIRRYLIVTIWIMLFICFVPSGLGRWAAVLLAGVTVACDRGPNRSSPVPHGTQTIDLARETNGSSSCPQFSLAITTTTISSTDLVLLWLAADSVAGLETEWKGEYPLP